MKKFEPVKPSDVIRERIAVLEQYFQQLKERGAPVSELVAQSQKIAQEYKNLMLVQD